MGKDSLGIDRLIDIKEFETTANKMFRVFGEWERNILSLNATIGKHGTVLKTNYSSIKKELDEHKVVSLESAKALFAKIEALEKEKRALENNKKAQENNTQTQKEVIGVVNRLKVRLKNLKEEYYSLETATEKDTEAQEKLAEEYRNTKTEIDTLTGKLKVHKNQLKAVEGSYNAVAQRNKEIVKELKASANAFDENSDKIKSLKQEYSKNNDQLKKFDSTLGNHQRNVGNYPQSQDKATASLGKFGIKAGLVAGAIVALTTAIAAVRKGLSELQKTATIVNKTQDALTKFTGASGETLDGLTAKVQSLGNQYDLSFKDIIIANNSVTKNLKGSFEGNLDILSIAFQNFSGDQEELLDILKEYPASLKQSGVGFEEFISLLLQYDEQGKFSINTADKLADAFKEVDLKVGEANDGIKKALQNAGQAGQSLAKNLFDKIAQGTITAKEFTIEISNFVRETNLTTSQQQKILQSLGTQWEDLGLDALKSLGTMKTNLKDVTNQTSKLSVEQQRLAFLNQKLAEEQTKVGVAFREGNRFITEASIGLKILLTQALGPLIPMATAVAKSFRDFLFSLANINKEVNVIKDAQRDLNKQYGEQSALLNSIFERLKKTNPETKERKKLVKELNTLFPELLENYDLEKAGLQDIAKFQKLATAELQNNIVARIKQQKVSELVRKRFSDEADALAKVQKELIGLDFEVSVNELGRLVNQLDQLEDDIILPRLTQNFKTNQERFQKFSKELRTGFKFNTSSIEIFDKISQKNQLLIGDIFDLVRARQSERNTIDEMVKVLKVERIEKEKNKLENELLGKKGEEQAKKRSKVVQQQSKGNQKQLEQLQKLLKLQLETLQIEINAKIEANETILNSESALLKQRIKLVEENFTLSLGLAEKEKKLKQDQIKASTDNEKVKQQALIKLQLEFDQKKIKLEQKKDKRIREIVKSANEKKINAQKESQQAILDGIQQRIAIEQSLEQEAILRRSSIAQKIFIKELEKQTKFLKKGQITRKEFNERMLKAKKKLEEDITRIEQQEQKKRVEKEIEILKTQLKNENLSAEQRAKIESQLTSKKLQLGALITSMFQFNLEKSKEASGELDRQARITRALLQALQIFTDQVTDLISEKLTSGFDKQKEIYEAELEALKDFNEKQQEEIDSAKEERLESLDDEKDKTLAKLKKRHDAELKAAGKDEKKKTRLKEKYEKDRTKLEKGFEKQKKDAVKDFEQQKSNAREEGADKELALKRRIAETDKQKAIFTANVEMFVAIAKTLASVPFPASLVLAGAVAFEAQRNIAKIRRQKTGFKTGVDRLKLPLGVPEGDDTIPALYENVVPLNVDKGEMIVPTQVNKEMSAANNGKQVSRFTLPEHIRKSKLYDKILSHKGIIDFVGFPSRSRRHTIIELAQENNIKSRGLQTFKEDELTLVGEIQQMRKDFAEMKEVFMNRPEHRFHMDERGFTEFINDSLNEIKLNENKLKNRL